MFFKNFHLHQKATIRKSLLWEYNLEKINWLQMRTVIVQRVIERGRIEDFYAILNKYGIDGVKESIKQIPCLNKKDMAFVCAIFELNKEDLKCYTAKQLRSQQWNS